MMESISIPQLCYTYNRTLPCGRNVLVSQHSQCRSPFAHSFWRHRIAIRCTSPLPPRSSVLVRASASANQTASAKEDDLVFVAGSTGRVGSRVVRELIKLGFRVRAAVRSSQRASSLVQSVQQLKLDGAAAASPAEKLEIVQCDLEKAGGGIESAIGNAAVVVCSIGASEKELFDVTGPYRIDYMATKNLIEAATAAKVEHFILVTSLGTNKIGFPAFLLNLFWGVLCWKRQAEEALIASGLPYTIVRPGGMERPTDAYKETHNLVVASEDTYVGGQVSNLQVAELIACMVKNRKAAYCKVVEVIAETSAPLLPMEELLSRISPKRDPPAELDIEAKVKPPSASQARKATLKTWQPLSPYTAYEDLKPPSSPSPTPPQPPAASKHVSTVRAGIDGTSSRPLSPYAAKPAASALMDPNGAPLAPQEPITPQASEPTKHQPLSPHTSYEDLKPPTSPIPSAPKI